MIYFLSFSWINFPLTTSSFKWFQIYIRCDHCTLCHIHMWLPKYFSSCKYESCIKQYKIWISIWVGCICLLFHVLFDLSSITFLNEHVRVVIQHLLIKLEFQCLHHPLNVMILGFQQNKKSLVIIFFIFNKT